MTGLDPQAADGAADTAGADDADRELGAGRLRSDAPRPQRRRHGKCAACAEQRTAGSIEGAMIAHVSLLTGRLGTTRAARYRLISTQPHGTVHSQTTIPCHNLSISPSTAVPPA